jgi:hypothetical protein
MLTGSLAATARVLAILALHMTPGQIEDAAADLKQEAQAEADPTQRRFFEDVSAGLLQLARDMRSEGS